MNCAYRIMLNIYVIIFLLIKASFPFLSPPIISSTVELRSETVEYLAFPQSALNQTEVEIRLECTDDVDLVFALQFVIRSSQCDKEFFDVNRHEKVRELVSFYFDHEYEIPANYNYDSILYFKSKAQQFSCKDSHGVMLFETKVPHVPMAIHKVRKAGVEASSRQKRNYAGINGETIDGGAKSTLSSWHPVQTLPMDGVYFLILKFVVTNFPPNLAPGKSSNVAVDVQWRGPHGYLSAIDYPLLGFYALMCTIYIILAIVWLYLCLRHWRDILRIQYWIGAVIMIGMIEKAMFYYEYSTMNSTGSTNEGFIQAAELVSCMKRTMSRTLIVIVSLGYGVVKPRLGNTLNQIAGISILYFLFSSVEALARVSKNRAVGSNQKHVASIPLILLEVAIFWWTFFSLINTMRALRLRRNEVKLSLYRRFLNILCFNIVLSGLYICWTIYIHNLQYCLIDWKEYWVDIAFWHILFCTILISIIILWRPSRNSQRYAFTPLLDDSEDENDEDELFSGDLSASNFIMQRSVSDGKQEKLRKNETANKQDVMLMEELKWIDNNIPSSIVDKIFSDGEEGQFQTDLENSKML